MTQVCNLIPPVPYGGEKQQNSSWAGVTPVTRGPQHQQSLITGSESTVCSNSKIFVIYVLEADALFRTQPSSQQRLVKVKASKVLSWDSSSSSTVHRDKQTLTGRQQQQRCVTLTVAQLHSPPPALWGFPLTAVNLLTHRYKLLCSALNTGNQASSEFQFQHSSMNLRPTCWLILDKLR